MVTILGLKVLLVWLWAKQWSVSYSVRFWPCQMSHRQSMIAVTFLHALKYVCMMVQCSAPSCLTMAPNSSQMKTTELSITPCVPLICSSSNLICVRPQMDSPTFSQSSLILCRQDPSCSSRKSQCCDFEISIPCVSAMYVCMQKCLMTSSLLALCVSNCQYKILLLINFYLQVIICYFDWGDDSNSL